MANIRKHQALGGNTECNSGGKITGLVLVKPRFRRFFLKNIENNDTEKIKKQVEKGGVIIMNK